MKRFFSYLMLSMIFTAGFVSPVFGSGLAGDQMYIDGQVNFNNTNVNKQTQAFTGTQGADFGRVQDIRIVVATIIQSFLVLLGTLFLVYMFYGGYLFLTSAGMEERVEKAKSILRNAIIGLIIILFSYAFTWFVRWLFLATGDTSYQDCHPYTIDANGDPLDSNGNLITDPQNGC